MKKIILSLFALLSLTSCVDVSDFETAKNVQILKEAENTLGIKFDVNHDWSMSESGIAKITNLPQNATKVKLFAKVINPDTTSSFLVLNEEKINGASIVNLAYDVRKDVVESQNVYVGYENKTSFYLKKCLFSGNGNLEASFDEFSNITRSNVTKDFPNDSTAVINDSAKSFAAERGWFENEYLYSYKGYSEQVSDYNDEFKESLATYLFSYFKNGKKYDNLSLVKNSGVYNSKTYPITTGNKPIVVSPIYKCDGGGRFGNEVYNSDLYYYYYKDEDIKGDTVEFLEKLPKYKALSFNEYFDENEDDILEKRKSYVLAYFGDGTPTLESKGTYKFPEGYKIGFMIRAKTDFAENGKPRKQGELYGDGRLNNGINNYEECNFKSSKLGEDGPRVAWLTLNGKSLMCWESGTDTDFNDIIIEVEGGVEPIIVIPDNEREVYTFLFEDTERGDYDLNDVVIKVRRIDSEHFEFTLVACGANNNLYVHNINGSKINDYTEVHDIFGKKGFVNTELGKFTPFVVDTVKAEKFSYLTDMNTENTNMPYIENRSKGTTIKISRKGQSPQGIIIPYNFKHPIERTPVNKAYTDFNNWGENMIESTDWFTKPVAEKVWEK